MPFRTTLPSSHPFLRRRPPAAGRGGRRTLGPLPRRESTKNLIHIICTTGDRMGTNRLEAFSDGVIAVIITIMVLELKVPRDTTLASLRVVAPQFFSYVLSFLLVAIMWVNHHHFLNAARRADGRLLWTNNLLLFWMSLVPFVTA